MAARPAAGSSAAYGPPSDVHPVPRRAAAPPAALDLLAKARHGLDEAATLESANERFATAHLAALRTAAAVLAVRARPEPTAHRGRRGRRPGIRSAWEVLPEVAPELAEWSALFASGALRRARAEAGISGAASHRDADDLLRDAGMFLRLVERMLRLPPHAAAAAGRGPAPRGLGPRRLTARPAASRGPGAAPAGIRNRVVSDWMFMPRRGATHRV
ncbi:SAV_6107 family HEPN domain-containing protein [Streptomyces sp. NPDC057743]|uniref:SAV_6107 family HEPN domain-containing protein n=1 Tax=Streptomyces sp. NPDC057743 TaxID=3346236 RepID=UPI0036B3B2F4